MSTTSEAGSIDLEAAEREIWCEAIKVSRRLPDFTEMSNEAELSP